MKDIENQCESLEFRTQYSSELIFIKECLVSEKVDELFERFLKHVKSNQYLLVFYILNKCFTSAETRAEFGNRQDDKGNTAYHYAAELNYPIVINILNDKRDFNKQKKLFRFKIKNLNGKTPLDLACFSGSMQAFQAIWPRAGKSNHNPTNSLLFACQGGSVEIVSILLDHKKMTHANKSFQYVYDMAGSREFSNKVNEMILKWGEKKRVIPRRSSKRPRKRPRIVTTQKSVTDFFKAKSSLDKVRPIEEISPEIISEPEQHGRIESTMLELPLKIEPPPKRFLS